MKKLTQHILMTLLLLMVWQGDLMATPQDITLKHFTKTIGNNYFDSTTLQTIQTQSNIGSSYNASDDFITISTALKTHDNTYIQPSTVSEYYYEINIPKPTDPNEKYWVGKQIAGGGGFAFQGVNILSFINVKGKIVLQGNNATFKYVSDLYFGAWIPPNTTVTYTDWWDSNIILGTEPNYSTSNYKRPSISAAINGGIGNVSVRCDIGRFIYCESCVNVEIEGFNIDGSTFERNNNANTSGNNITDPLSKIGGKFGDVGWQTNHNGISIAISLAYLTGLINNPSSFPTQTLIKNCNTYNLGLDGFEIQNYNVSMENCNSYNNCRQGLSWVGGDNFTALNCNFYNQAKILNTSPGAGIDIEPEIVYNGTILEQKNGKFINCEVYDNGQWSVSNFGGTFTNGVEFTNCKFSQPENYTLMAEGKKIKFTDCEFRCMVWKSNISNTIGDETKFYNCDFYDIDKHGIPLFNSGGGDVILYNNVLGKRTLLDNCRFHIDANEPRAFISLSSPNGGLESDYAIVKNCVFTNNQPTLTVPNPINGNGFSGVKFDGKNKFINQTSEVQLITSHDLIFEGSNDACEPNETIIDGKIIWNHNHHNLYNNQLDFGNRYSATSSLIDNEGYVDMKLTNHSEFSVVSWITGIDANMNIGKNSAIITGEDGRIGLHNANISHFGKIICEKNSHFCFNSSTFNRTPPFVANTELYIDKDATHINNNHPITCTGIIAGYPSSLNPICIQGGNQHPAIAPYATCNPTYTNIVTSNSLTVMYNAINATNTCYNANGGGISYVASGGSGSGSYTYTLNNVTSATLTNLANGSYTLVVKDLGCSSDSVSIPFTILNPTQVNWFASSLTNVDCNGNNNGSINVTATGGTGVISYSILPTNQTNTTGIFNNLSANTYTITATDANSCAKTTTVVVNEPTLIAWLTPSIINVTCNGGSNGSITQTATGGTGNINYNLQPTNQTNTTGVFNNLSANTYTITATDANGCVKTTTVVVNEPTLVAWTTPSVTNVNCNGGTDGSITQTATGGTGVISYNILPTNQTNTTGIFNNLSANTYTITATDANGCSITSSTTITEPATALSWLTTSFTNLPCTGFSDGIIDVVPDGGTLPYTYDINNSGNVYTTGNFAPLQAGTYTIAVIDANACTLTYTTILNSPNADMCSCNNGEILVYTPNVILLDNPTASNIIANYNNGSSIVTGKSFYISGQLTIDQNITFDGCTMNFSPSGNVFLNPTFNLDLINNTIMQASCDWWGGIVAVYASNKIAMNSDATIKNSGIGIHALNNAVLEIKNAHFIDNGETSLYLANMTLNPYTGFIRHNTFTTQTNLTGQWSQNLTAIELLNVQDISIGDITDANSGNEFTNMKTGIAVRNYLTNGSNHIGIYNNTFNDIHANFPINLSQTQESEIVNKCYTSKEGSAIYADVSYTPTYNVGIEVSNTTIQGKEFTNCDKAIVVVGASLQATGLKTNNCLLGIMCSSPFSRSYRIRNNDLFNTHVGIELFGRHSHSYIEENTIKTAYGILTNQICPAFKAPIGIKFQNGYQFIPINNGIINHSLANNIVTVRAVAGVGIHNAYATTDMQTQGNTILLSTTNASNNGAMFFNRKDLMGIYSDACFGSTFKENYINGPTISSVWSARDSKGIVFSQGHDNVIDCNKSLYTRFGFYVWGNNGYSATTTTDKVTYNKMGATKYPWWFEDFNSTQSGTLGTIGGNGQDNYNEFQYGSNTTNLNPNGFKVYRNSIFAGDEIWTDPSRLTSQFSGASTLGNEYVWFDGNQGATYTDPCVYTNISNPINNITEDEIIHDLDNVLAVAQENIDYINFPIVGGWIDKQTLYNQLVNDVVLRNSDPELLLFYNTYNSAPIGQIYSSDLALQHMADSNITDLEFLTRYNNAMAQNNAIVSSDSWEMNERMMNMLEAKLMRFGLDSLKEEDTTQIHQLAKSCPFVEGTSVYKARVLWSNFEPDALFDDRVICIPQVLGKSSESGNTNNNSIDIDSILLTQAESQMETIKINSQHIIKSEPIQLNIISKLIKDISLYPNPAINEITIDFESEFDGQIEIYNTIGEKLTTQKMIAKSKKHTLNVEQLANGIYQYKIMFEDGKNSMGKFTIKK